MRGIPSQGALTLACVLSACHETAAEKVAVDLLRVSPVAVLIVPDGHRHLLEDTAPLAAVLGCTPADDGRHEAHQITALKSLIRQTDRRYCFAVPYRSVQLEQANVIVEAVPLEVGMLQNGNHLECLCRRQFLFAVNVMLSKLDDDLLFTVPRDKQVYHRKLCVLLPYIESLRLPSMVGETVRCREDLAMIPCVNFC